MESIKTEVGFGAMAATTERGRHIRLLEIATRPNDNMPAEENLEARATVTVTL
jgi:hypothetical protein